MSRSGQAVLETDQGTGQLTKWSRWLESGPVGVPSCCPPARAFMQLPYEVESLTEAGHKDDIRGLGSVLGVLQTPAQPAVEGGSPCCGGGLGEPGKRTRPCPQGCPSLHWAIKLIRQERKMIDNPLLSIDLDD